MKTRIDEYLGTLSRSKNTISTYGWALGRFVEIVGESAELSQESYVKFLRSLKHLSPSTKTICKSAVMGFYSFCGSGDHVQMEKANKHYIGRTVRDPVQFNRENIEKVLEYCSSLTKDLLELRDRAFVITLADSGLRISEICDLKRGDLDMLEHRAMVKGKRDKTAVVRFSDRSIRFIKEYLAARAELDGASRRPLATLPLFAQHDVRSTKRIRRVNSEGMRKSLKKRMQEAGINPATVRIHDFRHYFVTMVMMASGGNLKLAKELARHESLTTTQRYAHFADSELDEQYDEMFNK
jgi:site-specific recombinase XerD